MAGIDQVSQTFVKTLADVGIEGMGVLENRPFNLDQGGPVAGLGLNPDLFRRTRRGASREPEVTDGNDVVCITAHSRSNPANEWAGQTS